ncbi:MAG: hypothetical protein WEA11_03785 [Acidimicrobiales bacterium]
MAESPSSPPTALLYLATWLPPKLHQEFSKWCDDHHREQLSLPGFQRGRRFECLDGGQDDDPPQFLTMYDLDSLDSLSSDEYRQHSRQSAGLPKFLEGAIRVQRRECTVIAVVPKLWWPPAPTPLLEVFQLNDDKLMDDLSQQINQLPDVPEPDFSLRLVDSIDNEPLVLVDHTNATKMIETIAAVSGSLRSSWRCCFDEFG